MDAAKAAQLIIDEIIAKGSKGDDGRGVFIIDRKIRTVPAKGKMLDRMINDFPWSFMGIYTKSCEVGWLKDDIETMMAHG